MVWMRAVGFHQNKLKFHVSLRRFIDRLYLSLDTNQVEGFLEMQEIDKGGYGICPKHRWCILVCILNVILQSIRNMLGLQCKSNAISKSLYKNPNIRVSPRRWCSSAIWVTEMEKHYYHRNMTRYYNRSHIWCACWHILITLYHCRYHCNHFLYRSSFRSLFRQVYFTNLHANQVLYGNTKCKVWATLAPFYMFTVDTYLRIVWQIFIMAAFCFKGYTAYTSGEMRYNHGIHNIGIIKCIHTYVHPIRNL